MSFNSRHVGFLMALGAAAVALQGVTACSTEDADTPAAGGSGGAATGGGTSGGSAGVSTSGGTGGASGGSTATGGTGGVSGTVCTPQPAPGGGFFLDEGVADAARPGFFSFGDFTNTFSGGNFIYPEMGTYPLTSTWTAGGTWNIAGTVGEYSGFGFYFKCRADLSAFDGIEFTISGTSPMPLTMRVGQTSNVYEAPGTAEPHGGTCVPASTTDPGASCTEPKASIEVTADPVVHSVLWADFTGGLPNANVDPAQFMDFSWFFPWPADAAYPVDITIDNVHFMGGPPAGGTGGTGNGGTGGTGDAGQGGAP